MTRLRGVNLGSSSCQVQTRKKKDWATRCRPRIVESSGELREEVCCESLSMISISEYRASREDRTRFSLKFGFEVPYEKFCRDAKERRILENRKLGSIR